MYCTSKEFCVYAKYMKIHFSKMYIVWVLNILCFGMVLSFPMKYTEAYFDQKIDHFNFKSHGNATFKQRYLYNDTYWDKKNGGPIIFFTGGESAIDAFWQNGGFVLKLGTVFKGLVLFAEHRYYGKSLPFGNDSFDAQHIGLLSVQQALADYAFFVKDIKKNFKAENIPVIAFGGSYGGQLAAYMRFKYPNLIQGALASSAPMYLLAGQVPGSVFFKAVTKDFRRVSKKCERQVRAGFAQLAKWSAAGQTGLDKISETFRLCKPLTSDADYDHFLRWARNAFVLAAMLDYPYPTSFMSNFPAFPVNVMCERLDAGENPASGLRSACGLYYNATGQSECFSIYDEYLYCADPTGCGLGSDSKAWDYQACTEVNLEVGTDGVKDMFPVLPFNESMRDEYCLKTWNVTPRRDWLNVLYWGKDISSASNIIFSNGDLDPWAAGGVLQDVSDSLVTVLVRGGAHHLDLRDANPADPPSVKRARNFELRTIRSWLAKKENRNTI